MICLTTLRLMMIPVEGSQPWVFGVICTLGPWCLWLTNCWPSSSVEVLAGLVYEIPLLSPESAFLQSHDVELLGCEVAIPAPKSDAAGSIACTSSGIFLPKMSTEGHYYKEGL